MPAAQAVLAFMVVLFLASLPTLSGAGRHRGLGGPGRMTVMVASSVLRPPARCARSPWWESRRRVVIAGVAAATCSGVPSTLHALATGRDLLQATRAAATLVPGRRGVVAGTAVHVLVSAGWTAALAAVDRRHRLGPLGGGAAGMLIAALDLEVVGRANPAIRSLPRLPQWLDHVAFGAIVGALL